MKILLHYLQWRAALPGIAFGQYWVINAGLFKLNLRLAGNKVNPP
jgi:hypothetical protein